MKLTANFSLEALTRTEHRDIDNTLPEAMLPNILVLAKGLELVRHEAGSDEPVFVSNGYRCPALNRAVGGALHSDHMLALAGDCVHSRLSVTEFFLKIYAAREKIGYRQLIWEFGRWCHVAFWMDDAGQLPKPPHNTIIIRTSKEGYLPFVEGMDIEGAKS